MTDGGRCYERRGEEVLLRLRVTPGAGKTGPVRVESGELWYRVAAVPEKGRANKALLKALARSFSIPASRLALLSGVRSRHKVVSVPSMAAAEIDSMLRDLQ
jgi:uncharacterized protein (TIGR00251 family)